MPRSAGTVRVALTPLVSVRAPGSAGIAAGMARPYSTRSRQAAATGRQSASMVKGLSLTCAPHCGQGSSVPRAVARVSDHTRQSTQPKACVPSSLKVTAGGAGVVVPVAEGVMVGGAGVAVAWSKAVAEGTDVTVGAAGAVPVGGGGVWLGTGVTVGAPQPTTHKEAVKVMRENNLRMAQW